MVFSFDIGEEPFGRHRVIIRTFVQLLTSNCVRPVDPIYLKSSIMFAPNPADLAKDATKAEELVEHLGTITLEELNKYNCNNEERRLLSLFGIIFDVTSSEKGYGKDGACTSIKYVGLWGFISIPNTFCHTCAPRQRICRS